MQGCTLLQRDNHASTPPLSFLQAGCPSCHPTNSVKALKANKQHKTGALFPMLVTHTPPYRINKQCCWQSVDGLSGDHARVVPVSTVQVKFSNLWLVIVQVVQVDRATFHPHRLAILLFG